jgi:tRNA (cmo5U34)-methyltransferase
MINHFDKVAQNWDNNTMHHFRTEAIAAELSNRIAERKNLTALEFGAGTGLLSIAMRDYFSEITLMDSSSEMICVMVEKLALSDIHHLKPCFFDLEKRDYTLKTFDVIFTQMALHHVADYEALIKKFYKLLNSKGILAIADLYKEDGTFHDDKFSGHFGFNPDDLSSCLSKQGFSEVEYKQCFEIVKTGKENLEKKYPVFLMSGVK